MTTLKAFRLPNTLIKRLSKLAKLTSRTEKFYVVQALEYYLDECADAVLAKDRFNDPKAKIFSSKELRKKLDV